MTDRQEATMPTPYRAALTLTAEPGDTATGTEEALDLEDRTPGQALDAFLAELTTKQPAYRAYQHLVFTLDATSWPPQGEPQ